MFQVIAPNVLSYFFQSETAFIFYFLEQLFIFFLLIPQMAYVYQP